MARTEVRGGQILDGSVSLTADVTGTLALGNGGTGGTDAATARSGLGLGSIATQANPTGNPRGLTTRTNSMSFSATPTFDLSLYDQFNMTLTAAITSATFSNGNDGQPYRFRFIDNGTARAIALGSSARAMGIVIPTTTVISKILYLTGIWHDGDSKMDFVGYAQQA